MKTLSVPFTANVMLGSATYLAELRLPVPHPVWYISTMSSGHAVIISVARILSLKLQTPIASFDIKKLNTKKGQRTGMETKQWLEKIGSIIDAKDAKGFSELITEDGIFRFGNAPDVAGRKAIEDYVAAFFKMIKSSRHSVLNCIERDGNVVWEGQVEYTRLDDRKVAVNFCNVFYMKNGLIDKYLIFIDNAPLFAE